MARFIDGKCSKTGFGSQQNRFRKQKSFIAQCGNTLVLKQNTAPIGFGETMAAVRAPLGDHVRRCTSSPFYDFHIPRKTRRAVSGSAEISTTLSGPDPGPNSRHREIDRQTLGLGRCHEQIRTNFWKRVDPCSPLRCVRDDEGERRCIPPRRHSRQVRRSQTLIWNPDTRSRQWRVISQSKCWTQPTPQAAHLQVVARVRPHCPQGPESGRNGRIPRHRSQVRSHRRREGSSSGHRYR